jgi:hypothetical protein
MGVVERYLSKKVEQEYQSKLSKRSKTIAWTRGALSWTRREEQQVE